MSAKPTAKQKEILELMADGYTLVLVSGPAPWSYLIKSDFKKPDRIIVRSDSAFHLLRKGLIRAVSTDFGRTTYDLKGTQA